MDYPDYPVLRSSLHPRLRGLPPERLEGVVAARMGAEAQDVEDFLSGLQNFGRQAGGVFQRALPGVIQGASTGAAFGPWGALIGALGGGAISALSGPQGPQPTGPAPSAAPRPAPPVAPSPTLAPTLAPTPAPAPVASLLGLLGRPEVVQALGALALGPSGRSTVQVGSTPVPVGAVANLLSSLAGQGAAAAPVTARPGEDVEEVPAYLRRADGSLRVVDPTSGQDRAEALLELFESAPSPYAWSDDTEDVEDTEGVDEDFELYETLVVDEGAWR